MVVLFVVGGVHDGFIVVCLFFVKQKTAYEMRISDWSSDVCSSDLPGQVTAQVTQNVYDSPTGRILLIPQGARLIGDYDSEISVGQERVLLAWNRLRSEEHTSELQSLMRISYAVFCLKKTMQQRDGRALRADHGTATSEEHTPKLHTRSHTSY